jgi:Tfp pilus assembly pilus retraction ATPase PilT
MKTESAEQQLDRFLDAFTPEVADVARKSLAKLRKRLPHAIELVI